MISRLVLVLTLAAMMVCAVSTWYVLGLPRKARWDVATTTGELDRDAGSPHLAHAIEFAPPDEVIAGLPAPEWDSGVLDVGDKDGGQGELVEAPVSTSTDQETSQPEPAALEVPNSVASLPRVDPSAAPNQPASLVVTANLAESAGAVEDASQETIKLMRALHDLEQAAQAELRLRELGFRPAHVELARQFTDPDPANRAAAVRSLAGARGIVARDWFLWASDDDDPQVRRMAVTFMATSGNPELLRRLATLAIEDSDDEVRRVARRAIQR